MLIEVQQLVKQISALKKQRNSVFARIETLKLHGPNWNPQQIAAKHQQLLDIEEKIETLENRRL